MTTASTIQLTLLLASICNTLPARFDNQVRTHASTGRIRDRTAGDRHGETTMHILRAIMERLGFDDLGGPPLAIA